MVRLYLVNLAVSLCTFCLGGDADVNGDPSAVEDRVGDDVSRSEALGITKCLFSWCGWVYRLSHSGDGTYNGVMTAGCFRRGATPCVGASSVEKVAATMACGGFG